MRAASKRPNILVFMVDQMQAEVIRPEHPCQMPTVQALAEAGVSFDRHFTPSPHCCPSRATFATGQYPTRHGVWNNVSTDTAHSKGLKRGTRLWSEDLRDAGYAMGFAGKWHVSEEQYPADFGWQEFSPRKSIGLMGVERWHIMAGLLAEEAQRQTPERPMGTALRPGWGDSSSVGPLIEGPDAHKQCGWYAEGVAPGCEAIRTMAAGSEPWCVFVSTDMDYGNATPADIRALYDDVEVTLPESYYSDDLLDKPRIYHRLRRQVFGQLSEAEAKESLKHYWSLCTLQDRYFAELLATLDETGQADDTLVLFVADHGDYGQAHGLTHMGIMSFREAYHVPAVVRWPTGDLAVGAHVDDFTTLADWGPTFVELAGTSSVVDYTGRSLVPMLRGKPTPADWPDAWYSQTKGNESYFTQRIVMTRDWKYVCNWFDYDELYDLRADPGETRNLLFPKPEDLKTPLTGEPRDRAAFTPWPPLSDDLEAVRRDMCHRMWTFAREQNDLVFNGFQPVATPPYGPQSAFADTIESG